MSKCFILLNVDATDMRLRRAEFIGTVFKKLGFTVITFGQEVTDSERAENLQTQLGVANGKHVDFADRAPFRIAEQGKKGDLIVATEAWHAMCFRGALDAYQGKHEKMPVVEMYIDYKDSFASYKVFATRFAAAVNLATTKLVFQQDWITARPYIQAEIKSQLEMVIRKPADNPLDLEFLIKMGEGVPVAAPDWGNYSELIQHGTNGALYRTAASQQKAVELARSLPSKKIVQWVADNYNLDYAAASVEKYIARILNA